MELLDRFRNLDLLVFCNCCIMHHAIVIMTTSASEISRTDHRNKISNDDISQLENVLLQTSWLYWAWYWVRIPRSKLKLLTSAFTDDTSIMIITGKIYVISWLLHWMSDGAILFSPFFAALLKLGKKNRFVLYENLHQDLILIIPSHVNNWHQRTERHLVLYYSKILFSAGKFTNGTLNVVLKFSLSCGSWKFTANENGHMDPDRIHVWSWRLNHQQAK